MYWSQIYEKYLLCIHLIVFISIVCVIKTGYLRNWLFKTQVNNELWIPHRIGYLFFCTVVWINRKSHLIWIWFILYLLTMENILLRDHILCLYSYISFDSQVRTMENRIFVRSFLHNIPLCRLHTYWFVNNDSFKRRINVLIFAFFSFKS